MAECGGDVGTHTWDLEGRDYTVICSLLSRSVGRPAVAVRSSDMSGLETERVHLTGSIARIVSVWNRIVQCQPVSHSMTADFSGSAVRDWHQAPSPVWIVFHVMGRLGSRLLVMEFQTLYYCVPGRGRQRARYPALCYCWAKDDKLQTTTDVLPHLRASISPHSLKGTRGMRYTLRDSWASFKICGSMPCASCNDSAGEWGPGSGPNARDICPCRCYAVSA